MAPYSELHTTNSWYTGANLERVAFPLGGFGTGMICLEGCGHLSQISIRHRPDVQRDARATFAAFAVDGEPDVSRVLEGPAPRWRAFGATGAAAGSVGSTIGLPRFASARFLARFPFCTIELDDPDLPYRAKIEAFSPFTPPEPDDSSLPLAAISYTITNRRSSDLSGMFSFNMVNLVRDVRGAAHGVRPAPGGLLYYQKPSDDCPQSNGELALKVITHDVIRDAAWFRGDWFDALTIAWHNAATGAVEERAEVDASNGGASPGGSLAVPVRLAGAESVTITVLIAWYSPQTDICHISEVEGAGGPKPVQCCSSNSYVPWYAAHFGGAQQIVEYGAGRFVELERHSRLFSDTLYGSDLPPEVIEAVGSNLGILKSPTVLRQSDGRLWAYEGCLDNDGCCSGTCTHVWNYAQAVPHLFPSLERSLRQTEFIDSQNANGHQNFRASLPIQQVDHSFHAAADGQLGGIVKLYREWRIAGDTEWLRRLWPSAKASLEFCIRQWDPAEEGWIRDPHHNTYDIEFWGPEPMCTTIYRAALLAATRIATACDESPDRYRELAERAAQRLDDLYNGEYFEQRVETTSSKGDSPLSTATIRGDQYASPEALALLEREGPKYQYGSGCLSDQLLGDYLALCAGLDGAVDEAQARSSLASIHRNNVRRGFLHHANPQRATFAFGNERGLILCSWPHGEKPTLPMVYAEEVWTGIEYQVAANAIARGLVEEGLEIVRNVRGRYDGRDRNPFDEYECGHWYARALASYALIGALTGTRYDAVDRVLVIRPRLRGDFGALLATNSGFARAGVKDGKPFIDVLHGEIPVARIDFTPYA